MTDTPASPAPGPDDLARRLAGIEDVVGLTYGFMQAMDAELGQIKARQNFDHRLIVAIEETQRDHTRALAALDAKVDAGFDEMRGGMQTITNLLTRLIEGEAGGTGSAE